MTRETFGLTSEQIKYINDLNPIEHPVLERCRLETASHPRANYQISREQGAFMAFLIRLIDARLAIEIGVFTGYSAMVTALALRANAGPGARLFALDISKAYLETAQNYWNEASLEKIIIPKAGDALDSLQTLLDDGFENKIDFIFIDAEKAKYPQYYELALKALAPNGLIAFDNMFRLGKVFDQNLSDEETGGLRAFSKFLAEDKRIEMNLTPIGDGLLLARKKF